ncbi:MAG: hypothetical protein QGF09_11585 [Rhodospirillales bacterium]|nr:hypothetical protein [Rhodospirillales bacterium]
MTKDPAQAVKYYRAAADQGSSAAQLRMGISRLNGTGLAKDGQRAYFWFSLAGAGSKGKLKALAQNSKRTCPCLWPRRKFQRPGRRQNPGGPKRVPNPDLTSPRLRAGLVSCYIIRR